MEILKRTLLIAFCLLTLSAHSQEKETLDRQETQQIRTIPIYPGCEKSNNKEKCLQYNINNFVTKNFNLKKETIDKLPAGRYMILVSFKIGKNGKVIEARPMLRGKKAKTIHYKLKQELENESRRVILSLPKLTPGELDGEKVIVPYSIPIIYSISEDDKKKNHVESKIKDSKNLSKSMLPDTYPVYRGCTDTSSPEIIKQCTVRKIKDFLIVSFDMEMASKLFPRDKSTKFLAEFVIDKNGKIKDINAKAHKKEIAIEAIQVLKRLPKCKAPGYKNGKPVDTPFSFMMTLVF